MFRLPAIQGCMHYEVRCEGHLGSRQRHTRRAWRPGCACIGTEQPSRGLSGLQGRVHRDVTWGPLHLLHSRLPQNHARGRSSEHCLQGRREGRPPLPSPVVLVVKVIVVMVQQQRGSGWVLHSPDETAGSSAGHSSAPARERQGPAHTQPPGRQPRQQGQPRNRQASKAPCGLRRHQSLHECAASDRWLTLAKGHGQRQMATGHAQRQMDLPCCCPAPSSPQQPHLDEALHGGPFNEVQAALGDAPVDLGIQLA